MLCEVKIWTQYKKTKELNKEGPLIISYRKSSKETRGSYSFFEAQNAGLRNWAFLPTLSFLINGHARLLIFGNFSTLDTLIRASPFINFRENFHPPRLLGN